MESIHYLAHKPLLNIFAKILEASPIVPSAQSFNLLEVGCGTGQMSHLLKLQYKESINIVAIDPTEDAIKKAKELPTNVEFLQSGIIELDEKYNGTFDVLLFTKSLHHCFPLDKSIQRAYELLKPNGILVAEELQLSNMGQAAQWFCDRLDLLNCTGCLGHKDNGRYHYRDERIEEKSGHHEHHGHSHEHHQRQQGHQDHKHESHEQHSADEHLKVDEHPKPHSHDHHSHASHHHGEHHPGGHHHHHGNKQAGSMALLMDASKTPLERVQGVMNAGIPKIQEIVEELEKVFGDNVQPIIPAPFIYCFLVMLGLEDSPAGQAVMKTIKTQEDHAIRSGEIQSIGKVIVVNKA